MKILLYSVLLWLAAISAAFAQNNPIRETIFFAKNNNPDWLTIKKGVQINAADLVRLHLLDLGLSQHDELRLLRSNTDAIGFTHYRYQQYHRGLRVDGGELLVHEQNGRVHTLNGKLVRGLQADVRTTLPANQALQLALKHIPAQRYMWESPAAEALLRRIKQDPKATFYPKPELVLVAPGGTQQPADFLAVWKIEVFAEQPSVRKELFVSAQDGTVLEEINLLCDQNTPGTATTKYSGNRSIITDSVDVGVYRLVETTRGNGVETYNMKHGTDHSKAVDFIDDDNNWNNVNSTKDEVATDAHWGAEMTYDYYFKNYKLASVDGNDMPMIGFVHYDQSWSNAQWTGEWARFGDGNGSSWNPLTSLDVVGHEFTHGVTGFSAALRYRNESGALNESFSDIFGTAIEFWAQPEQADWLVGEDFVISGSPLRNMANPKAEDDPDTYQGQHWVFGSDDNGGVHTNSGVQNKWFYLLSVGGTGTNDNDAAYNLTGLGIDTAGAIAFRNLQNYLVVLSTFADAREGSMQAAEDLYGPCSPAFQETANAWHAVGVGQPLADFDLHAIRILDPQPLSCGLTGLEPVSIQFRYDDCNTDLLPGDKIPVAYQMENFPVVWDTLTLSSSITYGDTLSFTFSIPPAELATPGNYHLRCWTALDTDQNPVNNEVQIVVESIAEQNTDMRMQKIAKPASGCLLGIEKPQVEIGYWGCDLLPVNTEIQLFYSINGGAPVTELVKTPTPLITGKSFNYTFNTYADLNTKGEYSLDVWVNYSPDPLNTNDSLFGLRIMNPEKMVRDEVLTFEYGAQSLDSVFTLRNPNFTKGEISAKAAQSGANGYLITGGDIGQALQFGEAQIPTSNNVWFVNEQFRSKLCVCADLTGMDGAELRFDHKQTFSFFYLNAVGAHAPYGSALRVLANGEVISPTYKPITHSFDTWKTRKFDLFDYLGGTVEICFETHTGISPELDTFSTKGDQVMLDNIAILWQPFVSTPTVPNLEPDWKVMPNPGTGLFTIAFPAAQAQELALTVTDALGRPIRTQHNQLSAGNNYIPLNLSGTPAGVYFVRLVLEGEQYVRRIVISH